MARRFIALLVSAILLLTCLPVAALADAGVDAVEEVTGYMLSGEGTVPETRPLTGPNGEPAAVEQNSKVTEYDLWVGAIQINSANANNNSATGGALLSGMSYDPVSDTLTLNGVDSKGTKIKAENGLDIALTGDNYMGPYYSTNSPINPVIFVEAGTLRFSGNGTLKMEPANMRESRVLNASNIVLADNLVACISGLSGGYDTGEYVSGTFWSNAVVNKQIKIAPGYIVTYVVEDKEYAGTEAFLANKGPHEVLAPVGDYEGWTDAAGKVYKEGDLISESVTLTPYKKPADPGPAYFLVTVKTGEGGSVSCDYGATGEDGLLIPTIIGGDATFGIAADEGYEIASLTVDGKAVDIAPDATEYTVSMVLGSVDVQVSFVKTDAPTDEPTDNPTDEPTDEPNDKPTDAPTDEPTDTPDQPDEGYIEWDGKVVTEGGRLNLRSGPVDGAVIARMPSGTKVRVVGAVYDEWLLVRYGDMMGYASADYVKPWTDEPEQPTDGTHRVTTRGSRLNMRAAADAAAAIVGKIPNGARVDVLSMEGDWALVRYEGAEGYVSLRYIAAN